MKTSQSGIDLIKQFEGRKLKAYLDATGVPTIGYGHTRIAALGLEITEQNAEQLLKEDLVITEFLVNRLELDLQQSQFDALVSLVYNIGIGNFKSSTLLKLIKADPNDFMIVYEFPKWRKAGGEILAGLEKRRKIEARLYFRGKGF